MGKNLRQVRYNIHTKPGDELPYRWNICIINERGKIEQIKSKLNLELSRKGEFSLGGEEIPITTQPVSIPKTKGLAYLAYDFLSKKSFLSSEEWDKVYAVPTQIHKDRELGKPRKKLEAWLDDYLTSLLIGKK